LLHLTPLLVDSVQVWLVSPFMPSSLAFLLAAKLFQFASCYQMDLVQTAIFNCVYSF
jgi:hypothetical protein